MKQALDEGLTRLIRETVLPHEIQGVVVRLGLRRRR
jgi:hypothetical protein